MKAEKSEIYQTLKHVGANAIRSIDLNQGFSLAAWENDNSHAFYDNPDHHTLSLYLKGGRGTRRHLSAHQTTDHGYPGAMCLTPAGKSSEWSIESKFHFLHLYFEKSYLNKMIEENYEIDSRSVDLQDITFQSDPFIHNLCRTIILPLEWGSPADQMSLSSASQLLVQHLLRHYSTKNISIAPIKGGLSAYDLRQVIAYIEENLAQNITIDSLAELVDLSSFHFARMFKISMNETPHHYILSRRIQQAKALLTHSKASLVEIALSCGFSSQAHFSTRFKEATGLSPLQFRKLS